MRGVLAAHLAAVAYWRLYQVSAIAGGDNKMVRGEDASHSNGFNISPASPSVERNYFNVLI